MKRKSTFGKKRLKLEIYRAILVFPLVRADTKLTLTEEIDTMHKLAFALVAFLAGAIAPAVQADFDQEIAGLARHEGLIHTFKDPAQGRILLALNKSADGHYGRYIYSPLLTAGLGSNPVGLDRSLPTQSHMLRFRRVGSQLMAVIENLRYRATAENAGEKQAVAASFPESIIWSTKILGEKDGTVLIDFSSFLIRDAVGVVDRLKGRGQGAFKLDGTRSYIDMEEAHIFPENLEFDTYLTFQSSAPGGEVRSTTPVPQAVTLIGHTTLMKLPDPGYELRRYDARAAMIPVTFTDMSAPLDGDVVTRLARRFRLQKDDDGKVIKPIVFYVDHGVPEPMRTALKEGANWWATAFEKAGFPGGFRAEILPEDVHPLDARYNVINWVHRATRGWSYGMGIYDPRTGEMLRGIVLLGSLRVRQDIKIFEALMGAEKTGTGAPDDPVQIALSRIRQLAAHEVGHPLGFAHNMAASTYGGRASVMDYPAPDIRLTEGDLDASQAYGVGAGIWDDWAVEFLYGEYEEGDPRKAQERRVKIAHEEGLVFVADNDSRNPGTGHVRGSLWDTGTDPVDSLEIHMAVRAHALARFGEETLRSGESMRALHGKLVPLYLYHRYQVQAAAKLIGGMDFAYRTEGDGRHNARLVPWQRQQVALDAVLGTLTPEALRLPEDVLLALSPLYMADGDPQYNRERFDIGAMPMFDQATATTIAADLVLDVLFHPARLLRLAEQGARSPDHPALDDVLAQMSARLLAVKTDRTANAAVAEIIQDRYVTHLIEAYQGAASAAPTVIGTNVVSRRQVSKSPVTVLAALRSGLQMARKQLTRVRGASKAVAVLLVSRIDAAFEREGTPAFVAPAAPKTPPGSPIGAAESCWHCEAIN